MTIQNRIGSFSVAPSLDIVMKGEVAHADQHEERLTSLEKDLCAALRDAREKVALYKEKKAVIQDHIRLAKQEETVNIPRIWMGADRTLEVIHDVEWKLPGIRSQLLELHKIYDLGRRRAQSLQTELHWKTQTDFQQWRSTLLGKSPLSAQQVKREWLRLLRRLALAVSCLIFMLYLCWAALRRS